MTNNLFVFLLPTIFLIGTLTIYISYQSIRSFSNRDHGKALISLGNNSAESVNVEFFVMSKCPDAVFCEKTFLPSLLQLSSIVNLTVSYIAPKSKSNEFVCMHGLTECIGNKQQLCVQNMYSATNFIKYLLCQSENILMIPDNGEQCAKETSQGAINWSDVQSCVTSTRSNKLFQKSLKRTRLAGAKKSCTIHINGQFWCMHDRYWSGCSEGQDPTSFIKAICSRYRGKNPPIACATEI